MATNYNFSIVRNGLIFYVDAANSKSYVSGSNSWVDISRNNGTGSLINGPTFSSLNGGRIVFDGTNDYVQFGNFADNLSTMTISVWVNVQAYPGNSFTGIFKKNDNVATGAGWALFLGPNNRFTTMYQNAGGTAYNQPSTNTTFATNTWYNVVTRIPSYNGVIEIIVNAVNQPIGQLLKSGTITSISTSTPVDIAKSESYYNAYGRITVGHAMIHNRFLSDAEILQNYNATKKRFGL